MRCIKGYREVHQTMRLSKAARPRNSGQHARTELPTIPPRDEAHASSMWKSKNYGRVRTADQSGRLQRMIGGPDGNDDLLRRARIREV
jgi:hypothetical protein